jgi:NADPH:quinone reductase-like Zn-dependent oxidoreductase
MRSPRAWAPTRCSTAARRACTTLAGTTSCSGVVDRRTGLGLLADGGRVVLAVASLGETIAARGPVVAGVVRERAEAFAEALALVADGRLDPVARSVGGLDAIVEAHRIVDSRVKVGNVVVEPGA